MPSANNTFVSTALQANLERTAAAVEIPEKYRLLLDITRNHFGVFKRTQDLLTEMNHPFVNWEIVLKQLRTLSLGDFHDFNRHEKGLEALETFLGIYLDVVRSPAGEETRETAIRYLFDFLDLILSKGGERLNRNQALLAGLIGQLNDLSRAEVSLFRKGSTYGKKFLHTAREQGVPLAVLALDRFFHQVFRATYSYWLAQPDPRDWFTREGEEAAAIFGYDALVKPLTHRSLNGLLEALPAEPGRTGSEEGAGLESYLDRPDYDQIVEGYLLVADELERSPAYAGREYLVKLDFLFHIINVPALADIHGRTLIEINRCLALVFREKTPENLGEFVRSVFQLLKNAPPVPSTAAPS